MKVRKVSIVVKMFVIMSLLLCIGVSSLGLAVYRQGEIALYEQIRINAKNITSCAAAAIDVDLFQEIDVGDEDSDAYASIVDSLALFRDNSELEYIYTLKLDGDIVVYSVDSDLEEPADIGEECESTPEMLLALSKPQTIADEETVVDEWGTHLSAYSSIVDANGDVIGAVGVDISADWIEKQLSDIRLIVIIISTTLILFSLAVIAWLMSCCRRSLVKLNNKIKDLTTGDGDLTKTIDIKSGDEFEVISSNINVLLSQFNELIRNVAQSAEFVYNSSENLNEMVVSNTNVVLDMSSQIEEISASMEESSASSQILSSNLTERADDIENFVISVQDVKERVDEVGNTISKFSNHAVSRRGYAIDNVQNLQAQMTEITESIKKVELIREIAQEVAAIAEQTTMLSLNAQIEAARAGETGKGFAVVATEIGKLSSEIDRAVGKVNQTSEQILSATDVLAGISDKLLNFITKDVVSDYESFVQVSKNCVEITEAIRKQLLEVAEEGTVISNSIKEIDEQVQGISTMVNVTTESTVHLATATSQISKSMEDLSSVATENTAKSNELSEHVNKYKYSN